MSRVTTNSGKGYRHNRRSRQQHQMDLFGSAPTPAPTTPGPFAGAQRPQATDPRLGTFDRQRDAAVLRPAEGEQCRASEGSRLL